MRFGFEKFVGLAVIAIWLEKRFKLWSDLGTIFLGVIAFVVEGMQYPEADNRRE
jgi:hypothetical protein